MKHHYSTQAGLFLLLACQSVLAHEGPDPILHWRFDGQSLRLVEQGAQTKTTVQARLGPAGQVVGAHRFVENEAGGALFLEGNESGVLVSPDYAKLNLDLPEDALTVSAWVSIDKSRRWGGIAGILQDNGSDEHGWVLGYNQEVFTFGLASEQDTAITYMAGETRYELGKLYHVAAVYDGQTMQLFVNGKLDAESRAETGSIDYPEQAPLTLGAYHDANEFLGHRGRLLDIAIYPLAAKPKWIAHEYARFVSLAEQPAAPILEPLAFEIAPYLQAGTQTSITVMWKTNRPAAGVVHFGETAECDQQVTGMAETQVHEVKLEGLKPETQYFYRVESPGADASEVVRSSPTAFQTAVTPETPFAFAVISDTQANPKVAGQLSEYAWGQRPNFLLHPGDLVDTGTIDEHWTEQFFPSVATLISHVPFYPVLGNHERNAQNYFDYVSLPDPEYYYTFRYGNTQFFMIDSNRNVAPDSEQFHWLDQELAKSDATWKFVCHHHPPYSSDENDYGDLWKTNVGTRGDLRVRKLVPLYEKHKVDFVWNGHIHSYERTWPIRDGRSVESGAPIYMITGGGGGSLETPGPVRPFFQNTVRRGHHYCMVRVNGKHIEIQVYDIENRLFDTLTIKK